MISVKRSLPKYDDDSGCGELSEETVVVNNGIRHHDLTTGFAPSVYGSITASHDRHNDFESESCDVKYSDFDDDSSFADYMYSVDYRPLVWRWYMVALETNPLLWKSITAFFILGSGDLCGQGFEYTFRNSEQQAGVNWFRVLRFGLFGLLGAPWAHYFYLLLDRVFPPTERPFTTTTLVKVVIDQGVQAPLLLALMISTIGILKGNGTEGVRNDLLQSYWKSLLANWKLWVPFSFINLAFVKPELRVLFVNIVFFVWTIILSMMINNG